jgi:hypothetical protein
MYRVLGGLLEELQWCLYIKMYRKNIKLHFACFIVFSPFSFSAAPIPSYLTSVFVSLIHCMSHQLLTEVNLSAVLVFSGIILITVSEIDVFCRFVLSGVLITVSELDPCSDT